MENTKPSEGTLRLIRCDATQPDFRALVDALNADLAARDGDDHAFYAQFNGLQDIPCAVVAYWEGQAAACGAIKPYQTDAMEVKRMYTLPIHRGKGLARQILAELEQWAAENGASKCILETGKHQPEAIRLYESKGYDRIPNYGPYTEDPNSVCFQKQLPKR